MNRKEIISEYFSFSRRERIAILVLTLLIIIVFFVPHFFTGSTASSASGNDTAWMASLQKLEVKDKKTDENKYENNDDPRNYQYDTDKGSVQKNKRELFHFDPNKLSAEEWERLGIRKKTINTIQNYLSKGGRFRKPEDVKRIYGLFPDEYERIAPYIRIAVDDRTDTRTPYSAESKPEKTHVPRYTVIDINSADTTAFISLPGIGSKLAARIVNFRDKLGGFYSVNQLGEIYGLADSTFQKIIPYIKLENPSLRKININTATLDELKAHPYIKYSLANPIIAYRNEHGPFAKLEDLKKVMAVTEELYNKISPYFTL